MNETSGRRAHGGVSPRQAAPAATPATPAPTDADLTGQPVEEGLAPAAAAHPDFTYNQGPVIRSPQVHTAFWGPNWSDAIHAPRADRLNQFIRDLLNSEYMNVLSQYGVGAGAGAAGTLLDSIFVADITGQLDEARIASLIQRSIDSGTLPEPPDTGNNMVLVIYLDETAAVSEPGLRMCEPDSDDAFGFHSDFRTSAGHELYYAVVPALDDACVTNTCRGMNCSLQPNLTQEQRLTQVTSHEFAEMCTDPKVPSGWTAPNVQENGDLCNGQSATITVGPNTWTVQRQYSKTDDEQSNGATICVAGAPAPMALRNDGPT